MNQHTSYVYIMQTVDYLKIGVTSSSINKRAKSIQTGCPQIIEDINYFSFGSRALAFEAESILHKLFSDHKTVGEWFVRFKGYVIKSEKKLDMNSAKIQFNQITITESDIAVRTNRHKRQKVRLEEEAEMDGIIKNLRVKEGFEKKLAKLYKNHPNLGIWENSK